MADDAEGPRDGEDSLPVALLTNARDALYLTLDRISGQRHHKLTVVLPTEIDDVESKLNRLISGTANTNDSRRCSVEVDGLPEPSRSIMHGMDSFNTSTPQRSSESRKEYSHTRPSPERMDAQMRALTMSQEVLIRQLIEQNEELKKQNALFSQEVTKNREEIEKLKSKVESSSATAMLITPMPALAPGSPAMHHPGLDRSGLRPPMPPMPPAGASPYGYPGYRPHEYDFSGGTPHPPPPLTAYSHHPQGYPLYGPPPPMPPHYPYPPQPGHQLPPTMPPSIGNSLTPKVPSVSAAVDATADDEEGYYVCDEDDYGAEEEDPSAALQPSLGQDQLGMPAMPAATAAGFTIPDSQLIHDWPYGNNVNLEGKSTLTYSPNHPPMPPQPTYFPQMPPLATGPRPAMPPPTMVVSVPTAIGPGFFSSSERPNISAFGSRFQSPTHMPAMSAAGGIPSVMVGLPRQPSVATLSPPKPGFLPPVTVQSATSISSKIPPPNASLTPSAAAINPAQTAMPTSTMVSEGVSLIASGIFTTPVTSEPAAATSTTGDSPFGTKYIMTMPAGTSTEAKPPASLSEPIAFNFGLNDGVNPSTIDNPEEEEDDTLAGDDGYQGPDFEPVIPLPDEVEVVTGEEDEMILFSARTKLFRFIENQWKERGLGEIRILHDAANGRVRTVMRREQVHKVCMNHCLNPKMTIDFKSTTEKKVLSWQAIDFAEGESQMEKFCARFKTEVIAREFKDKFEEGVQLSGQKKATTAKTPVAPESKKPGLFEKFKPKTGTWDCDTCMINNSADQKRCVACTTPRPGITPEKDESTKVTMAAEGGFSFESASGVAVDPGGFKFGGSTVKICGNSGGFAFPSINTSSVPPAGTSDTTAIGSSEVGNSLFGNPATSGFQFGSTTTRTVADKLSTFAFPTSVGPAATGKPSIVDGSSGVASLASDAKKTPISVPMISPPKFKFVSTTTTTPSSTTTSTPSVAFNFQGVSLSTKSTFKFGESNLTEASTDTPAADMLKALANKSKPTDVTKPKATNQLGGFTFISKPVLSQEQPKEEKPKEEEAPKEEAKSSPFAGFSFVKPTSTSNNTSVFGDSSVVGSSNVLAKSLFGAPPSQKDTARVADEVVSKQFGSETGATIQTFGGLIGGDTAKADAFSKKSDFKGFSGAGSQLFTTSTPKSGDDTAGDDEYEPDVDFHPIIPLPDLVVTETGEESEEKLFSDRVKLFRNDQESKQWKERGIGEIKILKHKETNRCRLLMRREQVLKICCNQIISSDIKLQRLATSDKAWCWLAQDFSEGEVKIEQFAVRFKSIDLAVKFKEVYVAAQMSVTEVKPKEAKDKTGKKNQVPVKEKLLKDMFKPTEGEWQCESCYVKSCNPTVCPACLTAKAGVAPPKPDPQPEVSSTVPGFRFGSGIASKTDKKKDASLKDMFKTPEGEWQCDTCYVKSRDPAACPACMTPKPGAEPPKPQPEVSSTSTVGGFTFGSGGGFKFGSKTTTEEKPKSTQFLKELLNASNDSADSNVVSSTTTAGSEFGTFKVSGAPTSSSFSFSKSSDDKEVEDTKSSAPFTFTPSSSTISGLFGKPTDANSSEVTKSSVFTFTPSKSIVSSTTGTGFVFGKDSTDSGSSFCFTGVTPSKPLDLSATRSPKSPGDDSDFYVNQDGDDSHIYFEPIVQLEKVEVKTGEEDEEVIYCHRAKLFLFSDREWKERGRGDVKILKHKETKKHRIIMRREQVHKLCLNHYVTPDLEMVPLANANGKAWVWQADDFIDNEIKHEQLAIRFRDEETAAAFHGAFLKSQEVMKSFLTPTKKDGSLSAGSAAVSSHSVKESSEKLGKEKQQLVQSSQVTSSKMKDSANFVFGGTPAPSSFSFTTSSTLDSKPAVFDGTPRFSGASAFNVSSAKFSFGSTTMALTEAHFGGMKESANVAGSGASPLDKAKSLLELMLNQQSDPVPADADDIVIISEKSATPEQVARARVLQLPDHFYLYEDMEPCSGCLGCDDGEGKMVGREEPKAGSVIEETVTMIHANITGKDGNPYYTKQLNQEETADLLLSDLEVTVVPKTACLADDKGNTHYAKQLELAAKNIYADATHSSVPAIDSVIPKTACATDDKGNPHYAEELQMAAQNIDAKPGDVEPSSLFERGEQGAEFTFDGVATGSSGIPTFGFGQNKEGYGQKPFSWQGAGSSLFSASGPRNQEDEDGVVTSDDVHFEPVISLPEVEVKTGEEDEDALYCHRAKLFRFDSKLNQWKERGVGDMKLLRHRETGRIRVLMRREKVLKLACNHALTTAMSLKPLHTSEVAWCWFALDIAEGEPRQEHLAIKFKTAEIAGIFKQKFEECQALLASSTPGKPGGDNCSKSEILSPDTSTYTAGASAGGHDNSQSQADDTEDYDDYGDEEDEQPWFTKRCTMMYADGDSWKTVGMGELDVTYDDDVNGARVTMATDNNTVICNHIICREYSVQCNETKLFCEWTAKDFSNDDPVKRTFRVQFSSKPSIREFQKIFEQGLELADDSQLSESVDQGVVSQELYK